MSEVQPIPLLHSGQVGNYFGTEYEKLPRELDPSISEAGELLISQGLMYLGKLTCLQFSQVEIYAYMSKEDAEEIAKYTSYESYSQSILLAIESVEKGSGESAVGSRRYSRFI